MCSNVPAESPKNYYLRRLNCPFLDCVILQLDQQFSGHVEAVMRSNSLLPAKVVTANFCGVEPAVNLFFTGAPTDKSQSSVPAVAKILSKSF